jgi:ketosteroid isomerase-like protein
MERVGAAWSSGDLDALRALLHPDGSWAFVDARPRVIQDTDRLLDAIRELQSDGLYQVSNITHQSLSEHVLLGTCQVRTSIRGRGGHSLAPYFLLLEVRDGLFYRSESFPNESSARAAFARGWGP